MRISHFGESFCLLPRLGVGRSENLVEGGVLVVSPYLPSGVTCSSSLPLLSRSRTPCHSVLRVPGLHLYTLCPRPLRVECPPFFFFFLFSFPASPGLLGGDAARKPLIGACRCYICPSSVSILLAKLCEVFASFSADGKPGVSACSLRPPFCLSFLHILEG